MKGPPGAGGVDRSIQNIAGGAFFHLSLPAWHLPPTPPSHTSHTRRSGPINWEICVYVCVRDGWLLPHRAVCCLHSVHVDKCDNTRLLVFRLQVNSGADCARAHVPVRLPHVSWVIPYMRLLAGFCPFVCTV